MPHSIAGSSSAGTGSTDNNSLELELAMQEDAEDDVNIDELNALQHCWRKVRIPFEVQVVGLMMVPMLCLVIFSVMIFAETAARSRFINDHRQLIDDVFECSARITDERAVTHVFVASMDNASRSAAREAMVASRPAVDAACVRTASEAYTSKTPRIRDQYSAAVRASLLNIVVWRFQVDEQLASGPAYRHAMTELIVTIEAAFGYMSQSPVLKDEALWLLQLRAITTLQNYFVLIRGVGITWLESVRSGERFLDLEAEVNDIISSIGQYIETMRDIASGQAERAFTQWTQSNTTQFVLAELPRIVDGSSTIGLLEWRAIVTESFEELRGLAPLVLRLLTEGEQVDRDLRTEGLKLAFAVLASALAAAYIVRAQFVSSRRVTDEVKESKKLHRAVTKFVPKSFLKLMGCTSVTHILVGDQTEVAVAMLFCGIHDFNTMAASMECEQLFDWLEVYFEQMSTITDRTNGFVDKFIGDALFCVFMNASDAVESAIEMTAMTDQLNGEIVCGGGSEIINVGIGIHHAIVSAGILGDSRRQTCTLVSSDVNLASRLEGLTKFYGVRIVASLSAIELCDRRTLAYRRLGLVQCKGRANGVEIVDVFQTDPLELKLFKRESLEEFHRAVEHQMAEEIEEAHAIFRELKMLAEQKEIEDPTLDLKLLQREAIDKMAKK